MMMYITHIYILLFSYFVTVVVTFDFLVFTRQSISTVFSAYALKTKKKQYCKYPMRLCRENFKYLRERDLGHLLSQSYKDIIQGIFCTFKMTITYSKIIISIKPSEVP